ncbi:MAG: hypothetical protein FWC59_03545, partial [Actinomycetia bacterium]|nr:hypothetical protein [Actinomycetes bacterium]
MPKTCEDLDLSASTDQQLETARPAQQAGAFLNRRNFLRLAVAATVGWGLAELVNTHPIALAVTSAEKQAEADEVARQMADWNVQLDLLSNQYYAAMAAHDQAVQDMQAAQQRIDTALAQQNALQDQLDSRVRTMYKQGPLSFLDVIFGSSSFTEFTNNWELLNSINSRDAELIAQCETARQEAEQAHQDYAVQEQISQQKLNEAQEAAQEAQAIMDAYEAQLASLEAEVAQLAAAEEAAREAERRRQEEL